MILHDPSAPFTVVRSWAFPSTLYSRTSTNQSVVPAKSFAAASAQSCKHQVCTVFSVSKVIFLQATEFSGNLISKAKELRKWPQKYFWPFSRFRIEGRKHYILPRHLISQPAQQHSGRSMQANPSLNDANTAGTSKWDRRAY